MAGGVFDKLKRISLEGIPGDLPAPPAEAVADMLRFVPEDVRLAIPPAPPFVDTLSLMTGDWCAKSFVFGQSCFTAPWGVEFSGFGSSFYVIQEGRCFARLSGANEAVELSAGDLIIFPHRRSHVLCDCLSSPVTAAVELLADKDMSQHPGLEYGGGGAATKLVHGGMLFEHDRVRSLIGALPDTIHLSSEAGETRWLGKVIRLIGDEMEHRSAGCYGIVNHLVQVILIQAIRNCVSDYSRISGRCLSALSDSNITSALGLMHRHPYTEWSVQRLADEVAMSRSSFAERFTKCVGASPMAYLLECRMHQAAQMLRASNESIKVISKRVGYRTESTFSTAFKRWDGRSPGAYRREMAEKTDLATKDRSE